MGDVITYTEGDREFTVYGLETKAEAISGAARGVHEAIERWTTAGERALAEWRGPHAATMVELHHVALDAACSLHAGLVVAAARCRMFPASPSGHGTGSTFTATRQAATLTAPAATGAVSAVPADLRAHADALRCSSALFPARAGTVDHTGLRAEVAYGRPLTTAERDARLAGGATPEALAGATVPVTEPYPVQELITLVAPDDAADEARARALVASDFSTAVAAAIAAADGTRLDLLAAHPELASFLVTGGAPDVLVGDTALAVLQAHFARLDTAADGGDPDGIVSRDDLEAAAADGTLPAELRTAAQYLLDNPTLYDLVDTGDDGGGLLAADGDISASDLDRFLETQAHVRALDGWVDELDTASEGGDPDGDVSRDDLEAAAADGSLPAEVRAAARYLLDHDGAFRGLADQEERALLGLVGGGGGFTATDLIGRLVNGQAYVHDPDAARAFVTGLPVATDGGRGLPITLSGDDGVRALAGSALFATGGDLTEAQAVIAHLPESPGAVRNQLITGFYDMLAQRVDGVAAAQWGIVAGNPQVPGSGGANWLVYAPWASAGVRSAIDGSFSVWGQNPSLDQRQAAADGNQWIFSDITARFAAFVELYEDADGAPSTEQVDAFFATTFDADDAEIRAGFEAYVAALDEDDPARRQILMFQGNTLVATHEQAGAQPYLEIVTDVPFLSDSIASEYIDLRIGGHDVEVNEDLTIPTSGGNLVAGADILDLDPSGTVGPGGWADEGFPISTRQWFDDAGFTTEYEVVGRTAVPHEVHPDPDDSLAGTAAGDWASYDDRMWFIHRMFEQTHTDPSVYDTTWLYEDDGAATSIDFLPDEVQGWVER